MRLVIIESPYAGDIDLNVSYARAAMSDALSRHEAPFASHLLYTQPGVLDDENPTERRLGIAAGLMWGAVADATVVYDDLGITPGMEKGIFDALAAKRPVITRRLPAFASRRVVVRSAFVESLRERRAMIEMSDDKAYTNGAIDRIDRQIQAAKADLDDSIEYAEGITSAASRGHPVPAED